MKAWVQTPSGEFVDVTHMETARRRHERAAWLWRWVSVGLAAALLYFALHRPSAPPCPAPDVMQLDPETIRATPSPGAWI